MDTVKTMFGTSLQIIIPQISHSISTKLIIDISRALLSTLQSACKITIVPLDLPCLVMSTVLQCDAKVWFAQQSSKFATHDPILEQRSRRVKSVLPEAIYPMSCYIDQIGKAEVNRQISIPKIVDLTYDNISQYASDLGLIPQGVIPLYEGNALTGAKQWVEVVDQAGAVESNILVVDGNVMGFSPEFLANPNQFAWIDKIRINPWRDTLPTFEQVVKQYQNLCTRVLGGGVKDGLAPVDYSNARGTTAQLVTSRMLDDTSIEVWSHRNIDEGSLTCGALFGFGNGLSDYDACHNRASQCCCVVVDSAGSIQYFVNNITKRLR